MESSPKAILVIFYVSVQVFPNFWQNIMPTHCSIFFIIRLWWGHTHFHSLSWVAWDWETLECGYWQQTGRGMSEHAVKEPHPWVPVHIGELIPIQILSVCTFYVFTLRFPDQNSVWMYYSAMCATYLTYLLTVPGCKYKLLKCIIIWNSLK
jgi:hypothetical protein